VQRIVLLQMGRVYNVCGGNVCVWRSTCAHMVSGKDEAMKKNIGYGRWCKSCYGACTMDKVNFNLNNLST